MIFLDSSFMTMAPIYFIIGNIYRRLGDFYYIFVKGPNTVKDYDPYCDNYVFKKNFSEDFLESIHEQNYNSLCSGKNGFYDILTGNAYSVSSGIFVFLVFLSVVYYVISPIWGGTFPSRDSEDKKQN